MALKIIMPGNYLTLIPTEIVELQQKNLNMKRKYTNNNRVTNETENNDFSISQCSIMLHFEICVV